MRKINQSIKTIAILMLTVFFASCKKDVQLPSVVTLDVSELSTTSAVVKSLITADGGGAITARGVCWSTVPNASIADNKSVDSLLSGESKSKLTNLTENVVYYARAYASNSAGTVYGAEISFTTKNSPILRDVKVSSITQTSCQVTASISGSNYLPITKKGIICYGTPQDYTIIDTSTKEGINVAITGLQIESQYTVKAFVTNASGTYYSQIIPFSTQFGGGCGDSIKLLKPNIYLYPQTTTNLNVSLLFPKGGRVTTSIPEYGTGWNVSVAPNGLVDKQYGYLFYESIQPNYSQTTAAWCIKKADLKDFFVQNMTDYGFKGQEITDFIDFWGPRLTKYDYYIIYPQDKKILNTVVTLQISQTPDNVLRLFYLIKGSESLPSTKFDQPVIDKSFSRSGFFVTEWGVALQ